MKLKTKLLIVSSACLIALSFAACGSQNGQENDSDPIGDAETSVIGEEKPDGTVDVSGDPESGEHSAGETKADGPAESQSGSSIPSDTTGTPEETEELIGPVPPPPATEAPTQAPGEPSLPSVPDGDGIETNEDGAIELPFVPFPED